MNFRDGDGRTSFREGAKKVEMRDLTEQWLYRAMVITK